MVSKAPLNGTSIKCNTKTIRIRMARIFSSNFIAVGS